jgi:alkylation response protein AidB-like acyl-CoA dehydrogenase
MDFRFTPEQEAFREEFISWLEKNLPKEWDPDKYRNYNSYDELAKAYHSFQKRLFDAGYATVHYPKEYGGQGRPMIDEIIIQQTLASTCMELKSVGGITFGMIAPSLLTVGNEEQKKRFLPKILDGTNVWCQGFSEPNAGSDVANVSTTAVKKGDRYIVNGQKVWITYAHLADYCMLLCRTDPKTTKHRGLSYLLVDLKTPGVEVRQIQQMSGESDFNDIFFEDVEVPEEMLVGSEGDGWRFAMTTLMFERVFGDATMAGLYLKTVDRMIKLAQECKRSGKPVIDDPLVRQQLGQAYIEVMILKYHGLRSLSGQLKGGVPGPEGSIGKILWSEPNQTITEASLGMQGMNGQIMRGSPYTIHDGAWQFGFLSSKASTIAAGSSEILRNIIGERILNLPKDSSRAARQKGEGK